MGEEVVGAWGLGGTGRDEREIAGYCLGGGAEDRSGEVQREDCGFVVFAWCGFYQGRDLVVERLKFGVLCEGGQRGVAV